MAMLQHYKSNIRDVFFNLFEVERPEKYCIYGKEWRPQLTGCPDSPVSEVKRPRRKTVLTDLHFSSRAALAPRNGCFWIFSFARSSGIRGEPRGEGLATPFRAFRRASAASEEKCPGTSISRSERSERREMRVRKLNKPSSRVCAEPGKRTGKRAYPQDTYVG